jgi:hypothetical protein
LLFGAVMKRTALALTLIMALLVLALIEPQFINLTAAAQVDNSSTIQIEKPNSSVIYGHTVPLKYNIGDYFKAPDGYITPEFFVFWLGYSLDGMPLVKIWDAPDAPAHYEGVPPEAYTLFLFDVPDGPHEIKVIATGDYFAMVPLGFNISSSPVHFIVDTASPNISILSPMNKKYFVDEPYITIPLTYETSEPLAWVGYSLDGSSNITISENETLIEIPDESSSLTLYGNDTVGNWAVPQTVYYEIAFNLGTPPTEPFPTTLTVAVGVIVAVICTGLIVYFKKRDH